MGTIGSILAAVGGIALLVFWIMTLIKQFKSGDTLWGVLCIFFGFMLLSPIWLFMNGHKQAGIKYVIAIVVYIIGAAIAGTAGALAVPTGM